MRFPLIVLSLLPTLALAQQRVSDVITPNASDPITITPQQWTVPWGGRPRDPYVGGNGLIYFVGQTGHYVGYLDDQPVTSSTFSWDTSQTATRSEPSLAS